MQQKKYFTLLMVATLFLTGVANYAKAQTISFLSKSVSASSGFAQGHKIVSDVHGNIYQIGSFSRVVSFGAYTLTPSINNYSDVFLVKYDSLGVVQWARRAGGTGSDYPSGIALLNGSIYVSGTFENTMNFNTPNATGTNEVISAGASDIFIAKFDTAGSFIWARRCGGSSLESDGAGSIAIAQSAICIIGSFANSINFNTPSASATNYLTSSNSTDRDAFLAKFDTSGSFIWARRIGGSTSESGLGVVALDTNIYISGSTYSGSSYPVKFYLTGIPNSSNAITISSNLGRCTFVAKYGSSGLVQWARLAGGFGLKYATSVSVIDTSVYICGRFEDSIQFNYPMIGVNDKIYGIGNNDFFLAKYNTSGTFLWAKRGGSASNNSEEASEVVAIDSSVYMVGYFQDTANFNTPSASGTNEIYESTGGISSSYDGFIAKYNYNGDLQSLNRIGGSSTDFCRHILVTPSGFYVTGAFGSIANFNTPISSGNDTISTVGSRESYLAKFNFNSTPLSVSLLDFNGKKFNDQHLLQWTTSSEQHNHFFNLQHSQDAKQFTTIGKVYSKALNGNSSYTINYEFKNENPKQGSNYYRLEQVDIDGKNSYSEVIALQQSSVHEISIYPNPVKDQLFINTNQKNLHYQIENSAGQLMDSGLLPESKTLSLQYYLQGIYFIRLDDQVFKFIKE